MRAALAAMYDAAPPHSRPKIDATWITAPLRRCFIEGRTSRVMVTAARRFAARTAAWPSSPRSISLTVWMGRGDASRGRTAGSVRLELEDVVPDLLSVRRVRLQLQVAAEGLERPDPVARLVAENADGAPGIGV